LGAKSFGESSCAGEDTDQAQVFGKNGREVLPIKIRSKAMDFVKDCAASPRSGQNGRARAACSWSPRGGIG